MALAATVACGGPPGSPPATPGAASSPACSLPASGPRLPADWPSLPLLPAGTVLASVQARSGARTVVEGVVPRPFAQVLASQRTSYERAGLVLEHGEVEPHDAESDFHGKGLVGRWSLREVSGCPGHTSISVVIKPTG